MFEIKVRNRNDIALVLSHFIFSKCLISYLGEIMGFIKDKFVKRMKLMASNHIDSNLICRGVGSDLGEI